MTTPAARFGALIAMSTVAPLASGQVENAPERLSDTGPASYIDTITVTGTRILDSSIRDVPASVSILDEETIAKNFAISTDPLDLLDVAVPGMTPNTDSKGSSCTANLRGRDVAFLINGVPVTQNLQVGSCSDAYNIAPFAIERVEVNRGASSVFGYGAPGGVINLVTRRARQDGWTMDVRSRTSLNPDEVDDSGQHQVYLGAGYRGERADAYVGFGYGREDLRHDPTGQILTNQAIADSYGMDLTVGYQLTQESELLASVVLHQEDRGDYYAAAGDIFAADGEPYRGAVLHFPHPSEHEAEHRNYVGTIAYRNRNLLGGSFELMAYVQDQHEESRPTFFFGDPFYDAAFFDNDRYGVRTTMTTPLSALSASDPATVTYGVDYSSNSYYGPGLDPFDTSIVTTLFSPEVTLDTLAGFAQLQMPYGAFTFAGGARYESYYGEIGDRGRELGFAPGDNGYAQPGAIPDFSLTLLNAGVVYDLGPASQVFAGISQGAQITEFGRAARNATDSSLINLKPAKSTQYEIGSRHTINAANWTLAAFYSESDLSTATQVDPNCTVVTGCPLIPLRRPERYWGLEGTLDFRVSERFGFGCVLTYQNGEFEDPDSGRTTRVSGSEISPARVSAYGSWEMLPGLTGRLVGTYVASRSPYEVEDFANGLINTESYYVMDGSLSYEFGPGMLALSGSNLLNEKYVISSNAGNFGFFDIYAEGRRISLTYLVRFEP
jgi:iron complex outermembrane recepter protein